MSCPCEECGSLYLLPLSQTSQSLLIPREALPETHLISALFQTPGTGGHLLSLTIINHYLSLCVCICLSSISSHWTLTCGDGAGWRDGGDIFSMSFKSPQIWEGSFLDGRDYQGETSTDIPGVSKRTQRLEQSVSGAPLSLGAAWSVLRLWDSLDVESWRNEREIQTCSFPGTWGWNFLRSLLFSPHNIHSKAIHWIESQSPIVKRKQLHLLSFTGIFGRGAGELVLEAGRLPARRRFHKWVCGWSGRLQGATGPTRGGCSAHSRPGYRARGACPSLSDRGADSPESMMLTPAFQVVLVEIFLTE